MAIIFHKKERTEQWVGEEAIREKEKKKQRSRREEKKKERKRTKKRKKKRSFSKKKEKKRKRVKVIRRPFGFAVSITHNFVSISHNSKMMGPMAEKSV